MNSVNFNQLLCKNISENGEDIIGIFDTLICEKGENPIYVCVLHTQISNDLTSNYDKYYYRIVLRQLGNTREDMRSYRVDSGVFWDEENDSSDSETETIQTRHKTTRPGSSGKLVVGYEHNFEIQGSYEVDLYVKRMAKTETQDEYEAWTVKDLNLVSICPFQVIFTNC